MKMRLGLLPLGIIGIPMRIKGTGKPGDKSGMDKEEMEETGYKSEEQ